MQSNQRLVDSFNREITDLRISVTNRCNLDCFYCHNEGLGDTRGPREPQGNEMSVNEIQRITKVAHELGIQRYKITGGEPLIREDLEEIVYTISRQGDSEVSMTTNGIYMKDRADSLRDAGLDRVNISMDTPHPENFQEITRGGISAVYDGIDSSVNAGLTPVKINMVLAKPMAPYLRDMLEYVKGLRGVNLQIIEYMPELTGNEELRVDMDIVKRWLEMESDSVETRETHKRKRYHIGDSVVEVVDPVGNPEFCANCTRLRLTHDGKLKGCLNRNNDLVSIKSDDYDGIEAGFEKITESRMPYYGEFMVQSEDGEWIKNPQQREKNLEVVK